MQIRTHTGLSLDGFMAHADGLPVWDAMPTFVPGTHGTAELAEQCGGVVVGRTSFDQGFEDWLPNWPWSGKPVYVLTSRPFPAKAASMGVIAAPGGPLGLVEQLREAGLTRDVHVLGGPQTIQALLAIGGLDRLGMVVLPVLLRAGIPLFDSEPTSFSFDAWAASQASPSEAAARPLLRLERQRAFPDGSIEIVYSPM
jgi:dihydrofolate reductase